MASDTHDGRVRSTSERVTRLEREETKGRTAAWALSSTDRRLSKRSVPTWPRPRPHPISSGRLVAGPPRTRRGPLLTLAALLLLGAAAIHLAVAPGHLEDYQPFGLFFLGAGTVQALLALGLLIFPAHRLVVGAAAAAVAVVTLWAISRTIGLPFGPAPWQPLSVGLSDRLCTAMEIASALLLVAILRRPRPGRGRWWLTALAFPPSALPVVALTIVGVMGQTDDVRWSWAPVHAAAGRMTSMTYCTPGGVALPMDVYEPLARATRPAPAVLYVHGGGWIMGTRESQGIGAGLAGNDAALFPRLRATLTARGFVVASIDYRLAPLYPWPDQIEDAKCAVRFLRAHAAALGIDAAHIGAWGSSAGGNLVALLGTAGPAAGFDGGQYHDQSSRLQAVVDMFGPTDVTRTDDSNAFARAIFQLVLGDSATLRRSASPVVDVAQHDPPFLIVQGTQDTMIPPRHARELARRLTAAGSPVTLVMVRNTGHGLITPGEQPSATDLVRMVTDFFTRTLASGSAHA